MSGLQDGVESKKEDQPPSSASQLLNQLILRSAFASALPGLLGGLFYADVASTIFLGACIGMVANMLSGQLQTICYIRASVQAASVAILIGFFIRFLIIIGVFFCLRSWEDSQRNAALLTALAAVGIGLHVEAWHWAKSKLSA